MIMDDPFFIMLFTFLSFMVQLKEIIVKKRGYYEYNKNP